MKLKIVSLGLICAASLAMADDFEAMTSDQLQELATTAVDAKDADNLLNIMSEMQRRHMVWFVDPDLNGCEEVVPKNADLHFAFFGTSRTAYAMAAKAHRLEEADCSCLFRDYSFSDFTQELLNKAPDELTADDLQPMADYKNGVGREIDSQYRAFRASSCQGE